MERSCDKLETGSLVLHGAPLGQKSGIISRTRGGRKVTEAHGVTEDRLPRAGETRRRGDASKAPCDEYERRTCKILGLHLGTIRHQGEKKKVKWHPQEDVGPTVDQRARGFPFILHARVEDDNWGVSPKTE